MPKPRSTRLRVTVAPGSLVYEHLQRFPETCQGEHLLSLAHMGIAFLRMAPSQMQTSIPTAAASQADLPIPVEESKPNGVIGGDAGSAAAPPPFNPLLGADLSQLGSYTGS